MRIILVVLMITSAFSAIAFDGGAQFKKVCAACHTIGGGDKLGPDLAGVSERRKLDWIVKFVNYPEGMKEGDEDEKGYEKADKLAIAIDKAYKANMSEQEMTKTQVQAVLKYIDGLKKSPKGKIVAFEKNRKK